MQVKQEKNLSNAQGGTMTESQGGEKYLPLTLQISVFT